MLTEERREKITEIINEKRAVTVTELVEALDTSAATIRRDLTALDLENRICKVFGGATALNAIDVNTTEDEVSAKVLRNVREQPMFYFVPFGSPGRKVRYMYLQPIKFRENSENIFP